MGFKNFLRKLVPPAPAGTFHNFSVKCRRCGEVITGQINVNNEPSVEYDDNGKAYYVCRKVLMGSGTCFQQIETVFKFDVNRHVLDREITGGEFVEE